MATAELADVLEEAPHLLARDILPVTLPGFIETQDRAAVTALAAHARMAVPQMLHHYGHHVVAKQVFEGEFHSPNLPLRPTLSPTPWKTDLRLVISV